MKIGFFITARLKSTRLKQKILLPLNGKTIIERVIERAKSVHGIDGVVLCTSVNKQDAILYDYASDNGIQFFTGSEEDVLKRLSEAASYYRYDAFLSITADNPLFSVYSAEIMVNWHKDIEFDFIFSKGLPIGCNPYLIETKALDIAIYMKKESDTEIWGPFVKQPDFFKIGELNVINSPFKEEKRLTCDYSEDYKLLHNIYKTFESNYVPTIQEVLDLLNNKKDLWKINEHLTQRSLSKDVINKLARDFKAQIKGGKKYAESIGKILNPGLLEQEMEI